MGHGGEGCRWRVRPRRADVGSSLCIGGEVLGVRVEVSRPRRCNRFTSSSPASPLFCLRTVLDLSDGCAAKEVSFYGDSGLNSLCQADGIRDPVKERKQALSCGSSITTTSRKGGRGSASGHPAVRTGDGTRSPALATDG
ncbi:hypothetical protein THAOC_25989 [Thalassiosira oceanica]|uniref:Uncharacterized protein n=1 Tax=Thalassiosira oceanica TaxID=159749 RepID=K0S684_THAOC|nr:hypothetical protein THAOC_25989 [Thalassiosira oceanica]|eukprot:EJK54387.1 hypothetical protein THAOC_25989 [Thalassiosira oceanica]